jgi:M6 family metalloprotease-like protein
MNRSSLCALLVAAALFAPGAAQANPLRAQPVTFKNPDGTTFAARLMGDEFLTWAEDLSGYTLVFDVSDQAWHYATHSKAGRLVALRALPGRTDPRTLPVRPHLGPGGADLARAQAQRLNLHQKGVALLQTTGTLPMLVLLVKFNCPIPPNGLDCLTSSAANTFNAVDFDPLLNGSTKSVADYYKEISGNQLKLQFTIGKPNSGGDWIPLQYNDKHYTYNALVQAHPEDMISEAVRYLGCDQTLPNVKPLADCIPFNFAPYADATGVINTVGLIHVGPGYEGEAQPDTRLINSHESVLQPPITTWDNKVVAGYHTENELQSNKSPSAPMQIGVMCHELGHTFGLPDLYDTSLATAGLGLWSVMSAGSWGGPANDGTVPTHMDAWCKKQLGWLNPAQLTASMSGYRLSPTETKLGAVVLPSGMPPSQYFLIETRALTGYDAFLPGPGLAIYHIDELMKDNTLGDTNPYYRVDLEQADGLSQLETDPQDLGDANDLYPTTTNKEFTPKSNPSSVGYDLTVSELSVTNIARDGADVTFDLTVTPGGPQQNGFFCLAKTECGSGFCVDGVCCDTACSAGVCDACSRLAGATDDGTCQFITAPCDDKDACTDNDACLQGVCKGTPHACPPSDTCHEAPTCDSATGQCSAAPKQDGSPCDDGDDCTTADQCVAGKCKGSDITQCPAVAPCYLPTKCQNKKCDPPVYAGDGMVCDDKNACTSNDVCASGLCKGQASVVCTAPNDCFTAPPCDKATGTCPAPVPRAEGATCDDKNACTSNDSCHAGLCQGTVDPTVKDCPPPDDCHQAGKCSVTGECQAPAKTDGTSCKMDDLCQRNPTCQAGKCVGTAVVCDSSFCQEGYCVPESGQCAFKSRNEGQSCTSDYLCKVNTVCSKGQCVGDDVLCQAPDECHAAGSCNPMNGKCSGQIPVSDGTRCTGGECQGGTCVVAGLDASIPPGPDASRPAGPDASTPGGADAGSGDEPKKGCGCASSSASPLWILAFALVLPLVPKALTAQARGSRRPGAPARR